MKLETILIAIQQYKVSCLLSMVWDPPSVKDIKMLLSAWGQKGEITKEGDFSEEQELDLVKCLLKYPHFDHHPYPVLLAIFNKATSYYSKEVQKKYLNNIFDLLVNIQKAGSLTKENCRYLRAMSAEEIQKSCDDFAATQQLPSLSIKSEGKALDRAPPC